MPYSTIIKLKDKEYIKKFNGQQAHGLLFNLLSNENKQIANKIHEEYSIKPFTTSIIYRKNPCLRFTFLVDNLGEIFSRACLNNQNFPLNLGNNEITAKKIITIGKNKFSGYQNYDEMLNCKKKTFRLNFITPTTFRNGNFNYPLPDLEKIFKSLIEKWNLFSNYKYNQKKLLNILKETVAITKHKIRSDIVEYNKHLEVGFVGYIEGKIFCENEKFIKQIQSLIQFSFFAGIGYKTTMGMGQVILGN